MCAAGVAAQVPPRSVFTFLGHAPRLMSAFELPDAERFIEATVIAGSTPMR
jgi:hypothetical protein